MVLWYGGVGVKMGVVRGKRWVVWNVVWVSARCGCFTVVFLRKKLVLKFWLVEYFLVWVRVVILRLVSE